MKLNVDVWFSRWYLALFLCMFNVPTDQWTVVHKDPLLVGFSITPCYQSGSHGLRCYKRLLYMKLFVFCGFLYHRKRTIFIFNIADKDLIWGAHAKWKQTANLWPPTRSLLRCGRMENLNIQCSFKYIKNTSKAWLLHPESLESTFQLALCLYDEYS